MVSRSSLPASSFKGTVISYPAWNRRSKPNIGLTEVTLHGRSFRVSPASRTASSVEKVRTRLPGPLPCMICWAWTGSERAETKQ